MEMKIKDNSLYLVSGEEYSCGRTTPEVMEAALRGGADIIQLREKNKSHEELLKLGRQVSELCRGNNAIFIVNDDPCLAKELDADGVHLGQEDIKKVPISKAREILGKEKIIGISTHSIGQVREANKLDVDYIGFGPVFATKAKDYFLGTDDISKAVELSEKPVFCIGGIDLSNVDLVLKQGAKNIAVIRSITQAEDVEKTAREFIKKLRAAR